MKKYVYDKCCKHRKFVIYTAVGILFTLANIILVWLFIDIFKIPTLLSSTVVIGGLFVLKYIVYEWTGFTGGGE